MGAEKYIFGFIRALIPDFRIDKRLKTTFEFINIERTFLEINDKRLKPYFWIGIRFLLDQCWKQAFELIKPNDLSFGLWAHFRNDNRLKTDFWSDNRLKTDF